MAAAVSSTISAPIIFIGLLIAVIVFLVINYQEVPAGTIVMWSGETAPKGWTLCDGTNGTPDLRGRFVIAMGTGAGLTARTIGATGGAETHTLSLNEIPGHTHTGTTASNGAHTHTVTDPGHTHSVSINNVDDLNFTANAGQIPPADASTTISSYSTASASTGVTINSNGAHTHTFTSDSTGGGTAHNNMPPFYVLAYIMKL